MKKPPSNGFTALECCIVLLLLCIISAILIPRYSRHLMRNERTLALERLRSAIEYAKTESFIRGKTITLCASQNQKNCEGEGDWSGGYVMFENEAKASNISNTSNISPESLIQVFPGTRYGRLNFNAPAPARLNIHPNGMTMNFGTFSYYPLTNEIKETRSLVVNRAVRSYLRESE